MIRRSIVRKFSWLAALSMVFFLMLAAAPLAADQEVIYASYVNGFGSNHGWHDVDKAEGFIGYPAEYSQNHYAWKDVDVDLYGRLLKAYTFQSWSLTGTIDEVQAFAEVEIYDSSGGGQSLKVQLRAYNGVTVITQKTVTITQNLVPQTINIVLPEPTGGWTKEKVDNVELWVGATERKSWVTLHVFLFAKKIIYVPEPPGQASNPNPANGATDVSTGTQLSWTAGSNTTSHDVYFGTTSPGTFQGNQTGTTYYPGGLQGNTTYYWRIDEKGPGGTTTGAVWSFTTGDPPALKRPVSVFALPKTSGQIYIGWRLDNDRQDIGYDVYRKGPGESSYTRMTSSPITGSTNYLDTSVSGGGTYQYFVRAIDTVSGAESPDSVIASAAEWSGTSSYRKITGIADNFANGDAKVGDIDGDGQPDFLTVSRSYNETTQQYGNLHIKVYYNDGSLACDIDMGETEKIPRTAWTFWDMNGDGLDEVIGVMKNPSDGKYHLYVIDADADQTLDSIDVQTSYNSTRFKTIAVAYLDGQNPTIMYGDDHRANLWSVTAYNYDDTNGLTKKWDRIKPTNSMDTSHQFEVADIDQDGKDEVFYGVYVFDESGMWSNTWGGHSWSHADGVHVGDVDPGISGQEVCFHLEQSSGGIHLTRSNGTLLWTRRDGTQTNHAHIGWIGDVVPNTSGMELWIYHKLTGSGMLDPFLYDRQGNKFSIEVNLSFGPIDWDGTGSREVIEGNYIRRFNDAGTSLSDVKYIYTGTRIVADVIGDYREEVIRFDEENDQLCMWVYTNTSVNNTRKPSPWENLQYAEKHRKDGH